MGRERAFEKQVVVVKVWVRIKNLTAETRERERERGEGGGRGGGGMIGTLQDPLPTCNNEIEYISSLFLFLTRNWQINSIFGVCIQVGR